MATALARMTDPKEIRFQQPKKKKDEGEIVYIPSPVQQRKKKAPPNHRSVVNLDQLFNYKKRGDSNNNSTNKNDENVHDQKPKAIEATIVQPLRNGDNVYYQKPKETAAATAQPIVTKRQGFGLMDLDDTDQPSRPQGWISPKKNEETTTSRETENSNHENDETPVPSSPPAVVPNDPVFVDPPEPPEEQEPPTKNMVCPAGMDIDVFSDLPPDIQQELMNQGDEHLNLCARLDSEKTESTAYHAAFTSKKSSGASSTTSESNVIMNLLLDNDDDSNSKNDITKNNNTSESLQQEIIIPKKSVVQFYIPTTDDEHDIGYALPSTLSPTKSEFAVPPTLCLEESDTYTVQTCATSNTMATTIPDAAFEGELWKETQQKQSAKRNNNTTTTTATSKYDKYRALQAPRIEVEEDNVVNPDELEKIQNNLAAEYERKKDNTFN